MRAFGRIEKNPALALSERHLDVIIPVHAIPKGCNWEEVGQDLLEWLLVNHTAAPQEGRSTHVVMVAAKSKNGPVAFTDHSAYDPSAEHGWSCLIALDRMPGNLDTIAEKRCGRKFPSWWPPPPISAFCLWSANQIALGDHEICRQFVKVARVFPDLDRIDEIWMANAAILASERWASFALMEGRGSWNCWSSRMRY